MTKIIFIFLLLPTLYFSQNEQKVLDSLIRLDIIYADSIKIQMLKIDSLKKEIKKTQLENNSKTDSLRLENERLKEVMKFYYEEIEKLNSNSKRLKHIKYLFTQYPTIKLPFIYTTQNSVSITNIITNDEIDTLIFTDGSPVSIIGVAADTSNYFCFFYLFLADEAIPAVVTYSKNGGLISKKLLAESCWQGCESDCRSIVKINPDLSIEFNYEEYLYECTDDTFSNTPNQASGYVEYSKIQQNGELVIIKKVLKTKEELSKNPIIHTIEK